MEPNYFIAVPIDGDGWYDERFQPPFEHLWAVHPADLHLTVAFLGDVTEQHAHMGFTRCKSRPIRQFDMMLQEVTPLGKPWPFSALTLSLGEGHKDAYTLLQTWRNPILQAAGLPPEKRPPLPHVTVTRARRKADKSAKLEALTWLKEILKSPIHVHAKELALYTWKEDRTESRYKIIDRVSLLRG